MTHPLRSVPRAFHDGRRQGITSVCSAHPVVIEAALELALKTGKPVLIEATCNQVNQDGGYTGMTPRDFRRFVEGIAAQVGLDPTSIVLGGDHLGPNPWKHLPPEQAMVKAKTMIAAYSEAGFSKLHLDTSMGCRGEAEALQDEETASRAAELAEIAERHTAETPPVYVIGTEVPVPGGAIHALDHLQPTQPGSVQRTYQVHRDAFLAKGLADAFDRVIALVVQPGVEFGHSDVVHFNPEAARDLTACLRRMPGLVFEAHSTDYQTAQGLASLVEGGFSFLKVGPWLTFAVREALYGLDSIADVMEGSPPSGRLMAAMEDVMLAAPANWRSYYLGSARDQWLQRHFSYSDRIRYYWPDPAAVRAVETLRQRLSGLSIPPALLMQYLRPDVVAGAAGHGMSEILKSAVMQVLLIYQSATHGQVSPRPASLTAAGVGDTGPDEAGTRDQGGA